MILTLTLNPAADQTLWVDAIAPGAVNRPSETQIDPAGKGVNVSRMVHRLGYPTIALGFLAGDVGRMVQDALDRERVQNHFVRVAGQTRVDVTVVERASGRATSFYTPGPLVDAGALAQLEEMLACWLQVGRLLVVAGSIPPGVPDDAYARYVAMARARGVITILDADGRALALGVAARPTLAKPNVAEAARLLGRPLPDEASVVDGAREIVRRGVGTVVLSRGAAGAICVDGDRAWRVRAPRVERHSTVGAGDSLVAGIAIALARGGSLVDGLRLGVAAGAATAESRGTSLGAPTDVERLAPAVEIEPLGGR